MAKQKFLCNTQNRVIPMRDIFLERPGYMAYEIDVPEGIFVQYIKDGIIVDINGEPVELPAPTKPTAEAPVKKTVKKAVKKAVKKKAANKAELKAEEPVSDADNIEDILNGIDGE